MHTTIRPHLSGKSLVWHTQHTEVGKGSVASSAPKYKARPH